MCFRSRSSHRRGPAPPTQDRAAPLASGIGQSRDHGHARGRRSRHVHRDRPDRGERAPACSSTRRPSRRRPGPSIPISPTTRATSSVPLTPSADLQITKAGPANAVAGTNIVYTITVTNAGPSDATRRHGGRPDAPRPDVRLERRELHDGVSVRSRHAASRRDPHDHGDLRGPVRLYDAQSDRQHGDGVESDAARRSARARPPTRRLRRR